MTRTNLNRSFSLLACLALVTTLALAAPAAAVTVDSSTAPSEAQVGSKVEASATLTELYRNPQLESWQLQGRTQLTNATWTLVYYDQTGAKVNQESYDGANFTSSEIAASNGVSEVEVRITGTVPRVTSFSYDPAQSFLAMRLTQARSGGTSSTLQEWSVRHFTAQSQEARRAIESAESTIEGVSADTGDAERSLQRAIEAYNSGNFGLATDLAGEAENQAESAQQSSQTFQLALYAVGGLLVVGLLVGGFLWYRSQQDTYDKLG
jgi:hypothetical protein